MDTFGQGGTVYFRPTKLQENAKYQWKIGADASLFDTPVVDMNFTSFSGDVEVRFLELDYWYTDDAGETVQERFVGRRQ